MYSQKYSGAKNLGINISERSAIKRIYTQIYIEERLDVRI